MKIQEVNIDQIIPYAKNPRQNDEAIAKVASSLKEFGWRQPIVVDKEMVVIAGHTRLGAARRLNYKKVPIHIATDLTENQIKAYRIADNRVGQEAKWDEDLLSLELKDLQLDGYDLEQTGFNNDELDALLAEAVTEGLVDEDQVPPEPEEATSVLGDVWLLGNHRVMCGDSTSIDAIDELMAGEKADMVHTDPPYNIDYEGGSKKREKIANDKLEDFPQFLYDVYMTLSTVLKKGGAIYVWHASTETHNFIQQFLNAGFLFKSYIVWNKNNSTFGRSDYHWKHEPCIYGWLDGASHKWCGDRKQTTVWDIDRPSRSEEHPTMKPINLCIKPIENSSKQGNIVLDVFLGSGSTLIAAEKKARKCYGMELDPKYVDVIIQRWQDFTGKKAIHEKTNKTFDEMKNGSDNIST